MAEKKQERQLIEEMAELTQALCKLRRKKATIKDVAEEITGVHIMLCQIIYLYGCVDEVNEIVESKLNRQLKRIGAVKNED